MTLARHALVEEAVEVSASGVPAAALDEAAAFGRTATPLGTSQGTTSRAVRKQQMTLLSGLTESRLDLRSASLFFFRNTAKEACSSTRPERVGSMSGGRP